MFFLKLRATSTKAINTINTREEKLAEASKKYDSLMDAYNNPGQCLLLIIISIAIFALILFIGIVSYDMRSEITSFTQRRLLIYGISFTVLLGFFSFFMFCPLIANSKVDDKDYDDNVATNTNDLINEINDPKNTGNADRKDFLINNKTSILSKTQSMKAQATKTINNFYTLSNGMKAIDDNIIAINSINFSLLQTNLENIKSYILTIYNTNISLNGSGLSTGSSTGSSQLFANKFPSFANNAQLILAQLRIFDPNYTKADSLDVFLNLIKTNLSEMLWDISSLSNSFSNLQIMYSQMINDSIIKLYTVINSYNTSICPCSNIRDLIKIMTALKDMFKKDISYNSVNYQDTDSSFSNYMDLLNKFDYKMNFSNSVISILNSVISNLSGTLNLNISNLEILTNNLIQFFTDANLTFQNSYNIPNINSKLYDNLSNACQKITSDYQNLQSILTIWSMNLTDLNTTLSKMNYILSKYTNLFSGNGVSENLSTISANLITAYNATQDIFNIKNLYDSNTNSITSFSPDALIISNLISSAISYFYSLLSSARLLDSSIVSWFDFNKIMLNIKDTLKNDGINDGVFIGTNQKTIINLNNYLIAIKTNLLGFCVNLMECYENLANNSLDFEGTTQWYSYNNLKTLVTARYTTLNSDLNNFLSTAFESQVNIPIFITSESTSSSTIETALSNFCSTRSDLVLLKETTVYNDSQLILAVSNKFFLDQMANKMTFLATDINNMYALIQKNKTLGKTVFNSYDILLDSMLKYTMTLSILRTLNALCFKNYNHFIFEYSNFTLNDFFNRINSVYAS